MKKAQINLVDYLSNTMHFCTLQHGMYIRLLMFCARGGRLPEDERTLARIADVPMQQWRSYGPAVLAAFRDGAGQHHPKPASMRTERLRQAQRRGRHSPEQWARLLDVCEHRCVKCGDAPPLKDHIVSLYLGGSDAIENLQPLCIRCNASKGPDTTDYRPMGWQGMV